MERGAKGDCTDITEHPHSDKQRLCEKRLTTKKRPLTELYILPITGIQVLSVRNVFYLRKPSVVIRILIQLNTSAQNVADVVTAVHI